MTSTLFTAPHPLVPLATFDVCGDCCALEPDNLAIRDDQPLSTYSLFPSEETPDFLGRLHHLKALLRMSATSDPVSIMIHRVGPMLILDDGPFSSETDPRPSRDNWIGEESSSNALQGKEHQLMLAAMDPSLETMLGVTGPPPGLEMLVSDEFAASICVKNTFLDLAKDSDEELERSRSAPGRFGREPSSPFGNRSHNFGAPGQPSARCPVLGLPASRPPVPEDHDGAWSLIPYHERSFTSDTDIVPSLAHMEVLQLAPPSRVPSSCSTLEAMRTLFSEIPPQPSRLGRAVAWRCGQYRILLGADVVVYRTNEERDFSNFASFKMLPPGGSEPSADDRLDVYLENIMCDIGTAVWGQHQQGQVAWQTFNTRDLPAPQPGEEAPFDANGLIDQGHRLLHFLRQQCHREGGTYWLFRERNSQEAELFDVSPSEKGGLGFGAGTFGTFGTASLAPAIASLCYHLAKAMPCTPSKRQLLQKCVHMLEASKEEHAALYSMASMQLGCSLMTTPLAAIPAATTTSHKAAEPPGARLSAALQYFEGILKLLSSLGETEEAVLHEIRLQAHVAYAECIVKLVRQVVIPTYSSWIGDMQHGEDLSILEMKRLSAAFLFWRLFWLVRAQRALSLLKPEKREIECWILERNLLESMGDALYGLSCYPEEDAVEMLAGPVSNAEGICKLVEDGLREWGLQRSTAVSRASSGSSRATRSRTLTSPPPAKKEETERQDERQSHRMHAVILSKLNPLVRGVGDKALREDPSLRDELRPTLWTQRQGFRQSLALFERATARLQKVRVDERAPSMEEQATMKIAQKLAHLYNEEARVSLERAEDCGESVEEALTQAQKWMLLCGDNLNASRVLLNLSTLHTRRVELLAADNDGGAPFTEYQYNLGLQAIECCEEACRLSGNTIGKREGAFAQLRLAVHLSLHTTSQIQLSGARRRGETLTELADRHFGKALLAFGELREEREVAVCHFHMAELVLQERRAPGAPLPSKARLTSGLRHARRSADYWAKVGALQYAQDFISSNIRVARLLESQLKTNAIIDALQHLNEMEESLVKLAIEASCVDSTIFTVKEGHVQAVVAFRKEMSQICQGGLRQGTNMDQLKTLYRKVLRNESLFGVT